MNLVDAMPYIAETATILAGMFGMLKFLLRDTHKRLEIVEQRQKEFTEEMRIVNARLDRIMIEQNARMDGLYTILINRK